MPTPLYGQVSVSSTAQVLSATAVNAAGFTIKAPSTNANLVYLGDSAVTSSNGHILGPGDEFTYERRDESGLPRFQLHVSDFWVAGTAGDKLSWLASP